MEGRFTAKNVACLYIGGKTLFIQCEFYYEKDGIYFLQLDALLQEGEFVKEKCSIYAPGESYFHNTPFSDQLVIDYLQCHRMEVIKELKYSMMDCIMHHLNKEPELHEYRIGFMVG